MVKIKHIVTFIYKISLDSNFIIMPVIKRTEEATATKITIFSLMTLT